VESLEELRKRVKNVEEFTAIINAKETDLRAACDMNFDSFNKRIFAADSLANHNAVDLEKLWHELKKYKESLKDEPEGFNDDDIKADLHKLEHRIRDCEFRCTPPNAVPLGICSGNHQNDGRLGGGKISLEQINQILMDGGFVGA